MRPSVILVFSALLPMACRTAPKAPTPSGYVGIERVEVLAKGME